MLCARCDVRQALVPEDKRLDGGLAAKDKAVALAMRKMLEESFYWCGSRVCDARVGVWIRVHACEHSPQPCARRLRIL